MPDQNRREDPPTLQVFASEMAGYCDPETGLCVLPGDGPGAAPQGRSRHTPAIAIVGAGPGMGLAIARTFGRHGFTVALIARSKGKLDDLVARLGVDGIKAAAFPADVLDHEALGRALNDAAGRLGGIDVLEYSPLPNAATAAMTAPSSTLPADVQRHLEFQFYGAIAATQAVLPAMRAAGAGTLLYTTGAGSVEPNPIMGNINAADAALRNWALNLHKELANDGIQAAHVAIGVYIGSTGPDGFPTATADEIAPLYWDLHVQRDQAERVFTVSAVRR
jgi:NAD(P)-dependent dehydrogenase (short-subunit alcohol dehydrogenase family)